MSVLRDRMWGDVQQSCLIVGGGPSLRGFDWSRVAKAKDPYGRYCWGMRTIAVNRAAEFFPPDLWLSMDRSFWATKPTGGLEVGGKDWPRAPRVWVDTGDKRPGGCNLVLPCAAPVGTPNRHSALAWGSSLAEGVGCGGNSGYAALNLADVLGASPIYLLGFDMKGEDGVVTHFHDGYPGPAPSDELCDRWLAAFRWAANLVRAKVVVLEVTPGDSRLDCFEKKPAGEVL